MEEDQENPGLQRPPPSAGQEQPHHYLCLVISFPGVILLGIAAALTIFLISLKSNNNNNSVPAQTFAPSPTDPFWFDVSDYRDNDDIAFSFPTRKPTLKPTPQVSSSLIENDDDIPTTSRPTLPPQVNAPSLSPTSLAIILPPTQEEIFIQNARNRFQDILRERSQNFAFENGENSPQAKAQYWLIRDPQFYAYSEDRLVQRWVLATFAFGMVDHNAFSQEVSVPQAMQNWVQYTDECTRWFYTLGDDGNTQLCNDDGLYIRLDLRTQHLSGTLPSEIALLSNHLRYIHLFDNRIYGTMPSELGLLSNLQRLELTKNNMEGELPTEIGNLENLRFLGLGRNSFSGPLPSEMGKLTKLNTIGLEWNEFSEIPTELGNMEDTKIFNIDHNSISGTFPETFAQLTQLDLMNLVFNSGLVGTIPQALCDRGMDSLQADCDYLSCSCCTECNYYR